ncbi:hypothetical protein JM18_008249 [Phytophthora kernoviae]|uniref:acetyl-CoA C-acyltransferase n=2 Tax=Phytophthora kernoviae TaxID=325452 RepID=A0A8T0LLT5_9STRA|nr:hypothetical protein G195_009904 [Phytophthora kernoviae 00238/432]KAG2511075.1 hypothetical protein JM16_008259 [Phytophthora kernoviae]KAG2515057.1 hypothetical protein JM18_008249 [Phytophthora kernoviae]
MRFRLPPGTFPVLDLANEDMDNMENVASAIVDSAIEEYERHRLENNESVDKRWKAIKRKAGVMLYEDRAMRASLRTRSSFFEKPPTSGIRSLMAFGTTRGELNELMFGLLNSTREEMLAKSVCTGDYLTDCAELASIISPTPSHPLRSLQVKWSLIGRGPMLVSVVIRPRDFVYLESTGIALDSQGQHVGYNLRHSVEVPGVRELEEHQIDVRMLWGIATSDKKSLKMFARRRSLFPSSRSFFSSSATASAAKRVVVVDGVRLPFARSGTVYKDVIAYDMMRDAFKGLIDKTAIDPKNIDYVLAGTVIQEVGTSNIAREAALGAGIPKNVPAHTVTQACISSSQAICAGAEKILSGKADVVLAGGVETFSDVPIRYSKPIRERLINANKAMKEGPLGALKLLKGLKLKDLAPVAPAIQNFHTREIMGSSSDRLATRFGVTRQEMDQYTIDAHQKAYRAHVEGKYKGEILSYKGSTEENGVNPNSTLEKISTIKPAFIKPHGTHTAANSSFLTDGAAATLIMSEEKALQLGYKPKSILKDWTFVGVDPFETLLLGPAYGIQQILAKNKLKLEDIDYFEIHEAFAGQVLANLNALSEAKYCKELFGLDKPVGRVPSEKLNTWGGSLSLGHPFGATGSRLVNTASNKLQKEGGKYALLAACADSGLAYVGLIEKYDG